MADDIVQKIAGTYPALDKWRKRIAEGVVITHGSELHLQDVEWPFVPSSTVGLLGLGAASEHLHAIRLLIQARELFPSATATLARAALVGAAQTVWMLGPDDHGERMRRSASVVREDYRHHLNYAEFIVDETEAVEIDPTADEQIGRLKARVGAVSELAGRYGGASRINMSDDVLPAAVAATTSERGFQEHVQLRWRQMSGSAHSLLWPHYGQQGDPISRRDRKQTARGRSTKGRTARASIGTCGLDGRTAASDRRRDRER